MPDWMGLWFGLSPRVETLAAQAFAAALVIGSYFSALRKIPPSSVQSVA